MKATRHYPLGRTGLARIFECRNWLDESLLSRWFSRDQVRFMTTSKRVQDRSKNKRVHDLEIVTEKCKIASKVLFLMEVMKKEPEMIIPVKLLEQYRRQINLPKPNRISDFIRKSPKLFELYKDRRGVLWCGMTERAEELVEEEEMLLERHGDKAAEHVTRLLMMSVDKRLPLDKIVHFRRDFGLPVDFRDEWVNKYPQHFKLAKKADGVQYLELVDWDPKWAVTELEKKMSGIGDQPSDDHTPGLLSLPFPLKFPPMYKKVYRHGGKIEHFQKRSYLSPYADARGLKAGSLEFDKRTVAVMHEMLSFTIEKRLATTDHLTHFRREFVMPQKLMRLLLKHCGIFYVSERGKRFSVFLTEAYEGRELSEKCPLVLWKEKVLSLTGYRGKKRNIECFSEMSEIEDDQRSIESNSEDESVSLREESEESEDDFEEGLEMDDSDMEIGEVCSEYKDTETS